MKKIALVLVACLVFDLAAASFNAAYASTDIDASNGEVLEYNENINNIDASGKIGRAHV